jgi:hypothetical protein
MLGKVVERRPPAARPFSRDPLDHLEAARQPVVLLLARALARVLVDIAVMGDLVPALEHRLDRARVLLDAPGRHEKGLVQSEPSVRLQHPRHRDLRPVA